MSKRELEVDGAILPAKDGDRPGLDEVQFSDEDSDTFETEDEDEIFQQSEEEGDEENMNVNDPQKAQAWLPGMQLGKDEVLEADMTAYEMLHNVNAKWPCLTFDVLWDNLGEERRTYPASLYLVTGTQADQPKHNEIQVIKCTNLIKTQVDDDSSVSSSESMDEDPALSYRALPVLSGTNRIRATQQRGLPHLAAALNESSSIYIYNLEPHVQSLENDPSGPSLLKNQAHNQPIHTIKAHRVEGYALDWSSLVPGKLVSGDNDGRIFVTTRQEDGSWTTDTKPFLGHAGSVEDLQWSPTEKTVFASCSSDKTIKIWDTRSKKHTPALSVQAHKTDVNVLSWNKLVPYLIATGSDDGQICVWDLREFSKQGDAPTKPVASFDWHKGAITSIEWHPSDESVLTAAGADDQVTIWDLSVELDAEEQAAKAAEGLADVPSQLMFTHMGQKDVKEVHWHKQMPGTIISTSATGFNVFKSAFV
ncbi:WD40-repeat-containing domain protein [Protomyces lactucae-debilis]|uniref:Glutamate-rich WD repeat-containing protein 1 n=1 Tax=Protomyces lactucae-debilis TaxID=2754530 RepID=A0A1Y2EY48_PROLT|nr:WD40-repeat-containing domain protein [Protomyces lactucae-debilis]ORY76026.1 WD40-repeat-containing domain protein [Protomyces lactucae-debilis]